VDAGRQTILAVVVVASVWLIVHRPGAGGQSGSRAEDILRERLTRGEFMREQFEEAKRVLGGYGQE